MTEIVTLHLYRRHLATCHHPQRTRTYPTDELRRGWKKCHCPIQIAGTLAGEFGRRSTGEHTWERAERVTARFTALGRWSAVVAPPSDGVPDSTAPSTDEAARAFLEHHKAPAPKGAESKPNTVKKYRETLGALTRFADAHGIVRLNQWREQDLLDFREGWADGALSATKKLERIKSFFNFCVQPKRWLDKSPAQHIRPPKGGSRHKQKSPFTDDELARIYRSAEAAPPQPWHNRYGSGMITGSDLVDFIALSVFTGMRISDVVAFTIDRLNGNNCFLFQHKTGKPLYTWIPDWLRDRLQNRAQRCGSQIFGQHVSKDTNVHTDVWRRKLARVFVLAGPFPEKATPHRFRHTFARILLQQGVHPKDVSELMGDTEQTVRKHYSQWVMERHELRAVVGDDPRPRLIA
jgi:integrase